jgi:hypothetical protein
LATASCLLRHELILSREVQHHRAFRVAGLAQQILDADAVVADGRVDARARGSEIGEQSAETEAERADLARCAWQLARRRDGRLDVFGGLVDVEFLVIGEGLLEIGFTVPELDTGREAPKEIGRNDQVAFLGIEVGNVAHVLIDPEDLLQQHDDGTGTCRGFRDIGFERSVLAVDGYARSGHIAPPRRFMAVG